MSIEIGDVVKDRYEVLEEMQGGPSAVYRAFDRRVGRDVVLKAIDLGRGKERELRSLAALNHSNIVILYDVIDDTRSYLVLEYVEGTSLAERLKRGPLDPETAVEIGYEICSALEGAHKKAIVHLDVKPSNILISETGRIRVADFGIASLVGLKSSGYGTPAYASPEQTSGDIVDERSDLFSLGCLLYEMVAGSSPFAAPTTRGSIKKVLEETPSPLPPRRLPKGFQDLIDKALAKDPEERFQSAREMRDTLDEFRCGLSLPELLAKSESAFGSRFLALVDAVRDRPALMERAVAGMLTGYVFYSLMPDPKIAAMPAGVLIGAALPTAGLILSLLACVYASYLFAPGLAAIVAPLAVVYFLIGGRKPVAALAPAGVFVLFSAGLTPVFPLIAGLATGPLVAGFIGFSGGLVESLLSALTGELAGLEGVVSPLVVGSSLIKAASRSWAFFLQPALWLLVAAGLATTKRLSVPLWFGAALAFTVEAFGYYVLDGAYGGQPVGIVMRRLAFSLIIIAMLALLASRGRGRTFNEPD
ncbi:MAG: serine/threonine-protein kinase [Candidatus Aquicultorales bacterium]